jgi:hypothetical protein
MPIKIVKSVPFDSVPGTLVTPDQINKLSANLFTMFGVMSNGQFRDLDCSEKTNPLKNDTKTAYFNKTDLDALFAANPGSDGLFIYFGCANSNIYPVREPSYENKLMAVLVTGTKGIANLSPDASVDIAGAPKFDGGGGNGMDNGKLCPPDTDC